VPLSIFGNKLVTALVNFAFSFICSGTSFRCCDRPVHAGSCDESDLRIEEDYREPIAGRSQRMSL
jgi:hypothetical protein